MGEPAGTGARDETDAALSLARARWSFTAIRLVADTATSRVYRVESDAGGPAALKILKPHGADEIRGAGLMRWYGGLGAARLLDVHEDMILMEWLDGGLLGDMVRAGDDDGATAVLCNVIGRLHAPRPDSPTGFLPLRRQFDALLDGDPAIFPATHRELAARAAAIATALLADDRPAVPLHGDLHHDNVVGSRRGWLAIDPKGLMGDPAYDVANVFRNPVGAEALAATPARIDKLADAFSTALGVERRRILGWAAAQAALSACWNHAAGNPIAEDLAMLPLLLAAHEAA